jgi:hypothetical protein
MANSLMPECERIAFMLETAAFILRRDGENRLDSVAWRVADASGLLRQMIERDGCKSQGVSFPTGLGCLLATITRP